MNYISSSAENLSEFNQGASRTNRYIPEIDGLRAIAILSVFVFHLNHSLLPGGFTGVDVFFVISGYLITKLVVNELEDDKFSYIRFYQRRIARIAPAATLVIVAALAAGVLLYDRQEFSALGANAVAAALSVMNVKQIFEGGYFTASADAQPLIHYWSLGVEEQFYLLFPALLHLIVRVNRRHLTAVMMLLCLLGYALCIVLTPRMPTAAFYLFPTRAWELLAGATLAAAWCDGNLQRWRHAGLRMAAGLLLVAAGMMFARQDDFPGWIAILPVGGAMLMLSAAVSEQKTVLHRLLASRFLVFIGKLSFSLYLWHWVVFSFLNYRLFLMAPSLLYALKISLSLGAAIATYYLVERPARACLTRPDRRALAFGAFIMATALIVVAGWSIRTANYLSASKNSIASGGLAINADKTPSVVLIGDSQAAMFAYDLAHIARRQNFRANMLAVAASNELPEEKDTLWPQVATFLHGRHFNLIVLAQAWGEKLGPDGENHLRRAVGLLLVHADRVILVSQLPRTPDPDTRLMMTGGAIRPLSFELPQARSRRLRSDAILRKLAGPRVMIMPVADLLLHADGSLRLLAPNGRVIYHDGEHLSSSGEGLLHARLEQVLQTALAPL